MAESGVYKFIFRDDVPAKELEECFTWATMNTENQAGRERFRSECNYHFDRYQKTVVIDKSTDSGKYLMHFFTTTISKEFGEQAYRIERLLAKEMKSREEPR